MAVRTGRVTKVWLQRHGWRAAAYDSAERAHAYGRHLADVERDVERDVGAGWSAVASASSAGS